MRYRDLETGTFLTRDPIGYADGPNVYCYVHGNPITHFDALGLNTYEMGLYLGNPGNYQNLVNARDKYYKSEEGKSHFKLTMKAIVLFFIANDLGLLDPAPDTLDEKPGDVPTVDNQGGTETGGGQGKDAGQQATDLNVQNSQNSTDNSMNNSGTETTQQNSETITRYMSEGEKNEAESTGNIPNYGPPPNNTPRPTHVTEDPPVDSGSEAQEKYKLPAKPTHRATVPKERVTNLGPTPDGSSTVPGGTGTQKATPDPIPVQKKEIVPLEP